MGTILRESKAMPKNKTERKFSSDQDRSDALEQLGEKLKSAKAAHEPEIDENNSGWAVGVNYASVFTGAIIVGGAFGFAFDYFVHTKPWGLAVGIMFGFAAGTRSIVQMAKRMVEEDA